ncbi:hypothetical protein C7S15_2169 [Burkholderia cepacia]|nr:hypothetical protein [Burkholderia cepacia]
MGDGACGNERSPDEPRSESVEFHEHDLICYEGRRGSRGGPVRRTSRRSVSSRSR